MVNITDVRNLNMTSEKVEQEIIQKLHLKFIFG